MKFKWKLACIASVIAVFLAACGTDSATKDQPNGQANDPEQSVEETEQQDPEQDVVEQPEQEEQETIKEVGVKTKSDTQDYAMYVLPDFTFTGEEPGKDVVYSNENDMAFMRIEIVPNDEGAYDQAVENSTTTLEAASNGKTPEALTAIDLPAGDDIKDVKALTVETETGPVSSIIFVRSDAVVKLTIFDTPEQAFLEDFVRMGETIVQ